MDEKELAAELRRCYDAAGRSEIACQVHLFGIRYARELEATGAAMKHIVELAGIGPGYAAELSKGIKLARYVQVREPGDGRG